MALQCSGLEEEADDEEEELELELEEVEDKDPDEELLHDGVTACTWTMWLESRLLWFLPATIFLIESPNVLLLL